MNPPRLSIVLGTLNRREFLTRALASVRLAARDLAHEIIVVDGGSTDGTLEFLRAQKDVTPIFQGERLGAVRAFNAGFAAARGEYVFNFNDDAELFGNALAEAVRLLDYAPRIGQVAVPYLTRKVASAEEAAALPMLVNPEPQAQYVNIPQFGMMVYANFGVTRRTLGAQLGWWGSFYFYGGDTELSVKVRVAGFDVVALDPAHGYIVHYEAQDETRVPNVEQPEFNAKWRNRPAPRASPRPRVRDRPPAVSQPGPSLRPAEPLVSLPPNHMRSPVLMEYLGQRHGKVIYRPSNSSYQYSVCADAPQFYADVGDVDWLLKLREGGRTLFRKAGA